MQYLKRQYYQNRFMSKMQGWLNIKKSVNLIHHIDKLKRKKMIILIDAERAFHKIPHTLIRILNKLGIKNIFQHNKGHI